MDISHIRRYDVVASRGGTYLFIPGGEAITGGEVCKQYGIPRKVLEVYRNRGLCGAVKLAMLNKRWGQTLDEIHLKKKQLARMDYLPHELRINGVGRS